MVRPDQTSQTSSSCGDGAEQLLVISASSKKIVEGISFIPFSFERQLDFLVEALCYFLIAISRRTTS